jgi:hypothetical protein
MTTTRTTTAALRISQHAVERYQQRVDTGASVAEARLALAHFVSAGRCRPTPRWWMRDHVRSGASVRFCYCASRSDACAVIVDGTVLTVLSRAMFAGTRRPTHIRAVPARLPPTAAERARWRWDGHTHDDLDEAA